MAGCPYVFPGLDGQGPIVNVKRAWQRIQTLAEIPDVRFHDLRRTVGSWLAGSGESLVLIGRVLNHRDLSTTAIYARLNLDPIREALERHAQRLMLAVDSGGSGMFRKLHRATDSDKKAPPSTDAAS